MDTSWANKTFIRVWDSQIIESYSWLLLTAVRTERAVRGLNKAAWVVNEGARGSRMRKGECRGGGVSLIVV